MNDIHATTIRACLEALNDHILSASHDVSVALHADTTNEAIGGILLLQDKLNLAMDLCNAALTAHRLGRNF